MALKISSAQTVSIQTSFAATLHIGSIKINFIFGGTTDFELQPLQSLKIKTPPTKNLIDMKFSSLTLLLVLISATVFCREANTNLTNLTEVNKEIARKFYEDLWFSNHTDKYAEYVADQYVVHDIWERKNVTEPAVEQKNIADLFWKNGDLQGKIDYQIADGDLVATRWTASLKPKTLFGRVLAMENMSIINVFRIQDGKIVEIWNHRHDIETRQTLRFVVQGLIIGLIIALIPTIIALRLKRKLKLLRRS